MCPYLFLRFGRPRHKSCCNVAGDTCTELVHGTPVTWYMLYVPMHQSPVTSCKLAAEYTMVSSLHACKETDLGPSHNGLQAGAWGHL